MSIQRVEPAVKESEASDLLIDVSGAVMTITFNRPEKLNAVREKTLDEFEAALDQAEASEEVRVILLTGAGRAFCAGQDLNELKSRLGSQSEEDAELHLKQLQDLTRRVIDHPKVVIAALNGVAVGFGAEISIAADIRIASRSARIGFVEVTRGLSPTGGITWLLPRLIGHSRAADLLVTGEIIDAESAESIGVVSRVFPADEFPAAARRVAELIAANAPVSVGIVRDALRITWDRSLDDMLELEVRGMKTCLGTEDIEEGTLAFLDGRQPEYRGR